MLPIKIIGSTRAVFRFVLLSGMALSGSALLAQVTLDVLRTGPGAPSTATVFRSGLIATSNSFFLQFQFGFATEEEVAPNVFLDSITATFQASNDSPATLLVLTVDRSGAYWAPSATGALFLDPNSIQRQTIAFPALEPGLLNQVAYQVTVPIPESLQNRSLNFYFDLFDNQNSLRSLAWVGDVTAVPEPGWVALSLCGVVCWLFVRRRRR
jgi:hypothetical protein